MAVVDFVASFDLAMLMQSYVITIILHSLWIKNKILKCRSAGISAIVQANSRVTYYYQNNG